MRLTDQKMPWDDLPLAPRPYQVEQETWVRDCDGGAAYEGIPKGRCDTLEEALIVAARYPGSIVVYEMRQGRSGGEIGGSVAKLWDGEIKWVEAGHGVPAVNFSARDAA